MSSYMLSCCTTSDLSAEWLERRGIRAVEFNFELGGTWYKDDFGASVPPSELYARMLAGEHATTSQVSVGDYLDFFRSALEAGEDVCHVTLSSGISDTYNSACLAADQLRPEYPERTIRIVDSMCGSSGYGLLMDRLADLRDEGLPVDGLANWAERHRLEVNHLIASTDLTFLVRGGRVSPVAGAVGGMLKICPLIIVADDGSLQVKEKVRTKARIKRRLVDRMAELAERGTDYAGKVFISHADCLEDAEEVAHAIEGRFPNIADGKVHIFPVGATIGVHLGPGTMVLFFWGDPKRW